MKRLNNSGQTIIALLIFMLVAMTVTIASIGVAITNLESNNSLTSGEIALENAQSGAEIAIHNLERNPGYNGGTITLASGTATISVTGSGTLNIVSVGAVGSFQRTISVTVTDTANVFSLNKWSETP